ncbi:MAG: hypothetical protein HZB99_00145, partial [Candidatus Harrisonbacteria bacterium]|nr:hypothetical protein [Candidatus Harrisonbacteria bacterium]
MEKRHINLLHPGRQSRSSLFPYYARVFSLISAVTLTTLYVVYSASGANTTIGNNISTSGNLTVGSTTQLSGPIYASSTLQASGAARLYSTLTIDGNVGIGSTSPSKLLSVQGNALISGD